MSVSSTTTTALGVPVRALPPPIDDMQDTADDRRIWPALAPMLDVCANVVEPAFREADRWAKVHQGVHRLLIQLATLFGTAAVLFAILQLGFAGDVGPEPMATPEFIAASLACLAVGLGSIVAFQSNWLVQRNKAERLRLAKFRYLTDPELWSGTPAVQDQKRAELEQRVRAIKAIGRKAMHHWLVHDAVPHPPQSILTLTALPPAGSELIDYYRRRRLQYQREFFQGQANKNLKLDAFTKYLSPVLFFGSVGAVLIHFGYDIKTRPENLDTFSRWMILLAASLPVLGGTIRTFRSAYEFARNTYRYRAKAIALISIDVDLRHATDPSSRFLALWLSEQTLENEHREWLRLMIEAEWFG